MFFYQPKEKQYFSLFNSVVLLVFISAVISGCAESTLTSKSATPYKKTPHPKTQKKQTATSAKKPKPYKIAGKWYHPLAHADGFVQEGLASWYGEPFHGRKTANGEIYNMYAMTAAHKTLPLGTYVNVRNLNNNRTIVVKVNDRGPFVKGRIIDLSKKAAAELDVIKTGTAPVKIQALGKKTTGASGQTAYVPVDYTKGNFTVQVGAFKVKQNAMNLMRKLSRDYKNVHITEYTMSGDMIYRVRVGHAKKLSTAEKYERILNSRGYHDAFVIAE